MKIFSREFPKLKLFLGIIFSLFLISIAFWYTNLSPWDVFVVMSNADSPDSFSFVSKKDIKKSNSVLLDMNLYVVQKNKFPIKYHTWYEVRIDTLASEQEVTILFYKQEN